MDAMRRLHKVYSLQRTVIILGIALVLTAILLVMSQMNF